MEAYSRLKLDETHIGTVFGRLTIVGQSFYVRWNGGKRMRVAVCRCECGEMLVVPLTMMRNGNWRSCGCARQTWRNSTKRHVHEYNSWHAMTMRCTDPNNRKYQQYGGRGITVCERWKSFDDFLEDMGPKPTPKHTIDRIDNSGGYSPDNCRWANAREQAINRRTSVYLTLDGITKPLVHWAEECGVDRRVLLQRYRNGWSHERIITTPHMQPHRRRETCVS